MKDLSDLKIEMVKHLSGTDVASSTAARQASYKSKMLVVNPMFAYRSYVYLFVHNGSSMMSLERRWTHGLQSTRS